MWLFSGSSIPLWIYPAEGIMGLLVECAWLGALSLAAYLILRAGTRKLVIQGG